MIRFVCVAAVCGSVLTGVAYAQPAGCPTGFTMHPAQLGEHLADLNLDGQVCRSEADVRSNGVVETMTLDNDTPPCGCPPLQSGFQGPFPGDDPALPPGSQRADRNEDGLVCVKPQPRDPPEVFKFIIIDNRRCKP